MNNTDAVSSFFKTVDMPNLAEHLNHRRMQNVKQLFEYEEQVLLNFKISIGDMTYIDMGNIQVLFHYIWQLETYANARTLFHIQCRNMFLALLKHYNNTRLDLGTLIRQILDNEL